MPDLLFFGGLAIASGGVAIIYVPAGVILVGVGLSAVVYLAERRK